MLRLADAHCHLDREYFSEGPDAVMERARAAGVVGLVVVGLAGEGPEADALERARFATDLARRARPQVMASSATRRADGVRRTR